MQKTGLLSELGEALVRGSLTDEELLEKTGTSAPVSKAWTRARLAWLTAPGQRVP